MLCEMDSVNSQIPLEKVNNPLETFLEPIDLITPQLPHQLQSLGKSSLDLESIQSIFRHEVNPKSKIQNLKSDDFLTGQFPRILADNPPSDNTPATARNIDIMPTLTPYVDSVGTSNDPNDYYRFSLNATSNFTLVLLSDDGEAKVQLLASNGTTVIDNEAGDPAVIARSLNSGTYYIRVDTAENVTVEYKLAVGAIAMPFAPDLAGNTSQMARKIGVSSTLTTYKDWVGSTDTNDYYRFSLKNPSGFGVLLNGLSNNANVELLASNGVSVVAKSTKTGTQQDLITFEQLNAGTYYIRVYPGNGSETFYDLTVGSLPNLINSPINSFSDGTTATARNITVGSKLTTYVDSVSGTDPNDYYRFTLNNTSNFGLFLRGLSGDADVRLLASDGTTVVASSETGGDISERIVGQLNAGTYYIQVYPFSGSTSYNLSVGAVAIPVGFPDGAGNTTKKAKKINVGTPLTTDTDWVNSEDTDDYYRFTLKNPSNAGFFLNSLSGDANIEILASDGVTVVASSTNSGTLPDGITNQFDAGTYYIRVYTNGGEAKYNLTAGAIPVDIEIPDAGGDTIEDATEIKFISSPLNIVDEVSSADRNDYYRFIFSESSGLLLSLSELSADADVRLLDSNGDVIAESKNRGTALEEISIPKAENEDELEAGTYYIHVVRYSGNTSYNLNVSYVGDEDDPPFNSIYGYGLIDAAAAVAKAIELSPFNEVSDLGDYNWGNNLIKAPEVWAQGYTGEGITVAVIDDGVDINHVDLNDDIWLNSDEIAGDGIDNDNNGYIDDIRGWDFFDNDNTVTPTGNDKHGTHVAGTIAADNNGFGATGVAHKAQIMSLKVLEGDGSAPDDKLAKAIRYAVDNGAKVINMSLGWPESNELSDALAYAAQNNVITVTAAGNTRELVPDSPASYANQYGLSVGAVDINSQLAYFSSHASLDSDMLHVVAPGVNVYSTVPGDRYEGGWSGTSMASPHVAGVVALMFDANPNLTHDQVRQIIKETSEVLI